MPFIDLPDRVPGLRAQARTDQPWYQFRNLATDEAELFLYDEIGGWGTLAEDFIAELKAVTSPKLRVRVSSPGGSVFEGVAVANALRAHPSEVTVQVDGIAASIASVIAMAGDRVVMQPQAMIMVHDASGLCMGNAQDMADMADLLDKISGNIADAYVGKAGGTRDEWRQVMKAETWYTADEALEAGLADEVVPARKQGEPDEAEPTMRQFDLTVYGYAGPAKPAAPKPGPPPAMDVTEHVAEPATLVISIADLLDEDAVARLRAAVAAAPEPEPVHEAAQEAPATEWRGEHGPELLDHHTEPAAPVDDPWAAAVARLVQPARDPWAALVARFTPSTSADSSATQEA
jgi:ATP-dependent protease ClpP protease subunit